MTKHRLSRVSGSDRGVQGIQTMDSYSEMPERSIRQKTPTSTIAALLGLLLLVNLAASLYQLPLNRVIERRLCHEYYAENDPAVIQPDGTILEELCKVDLVQQGLGRIQGTMDTLWVVGDFITTIPLGFLAERYGRRPVLWLNLVPRIFMLAWAVLVGASDQQALPTHVILAGPVLSVLGGDCVFNSLTYSLAAGLTDDYALRASYFGYMSAVSYVVNLLGPALASLSMTALLWLPFWVGIALLVTAIPVIRMLPDKVAPQHEAQTQPLLSSPRLKAQQDQHQPLWTSVWQRFQTLMAVVASHPRNFTLMLACFLLASLASSDTKLLVQYISKRYDGWTFAAAGYLLSGKAVVNFVLLTVVIPRVLRLSSSSPLTADRINIRFAKACFLVSVLGALAIALAATMWLLVPALFVYALGSALPIFTLSLLKSPSITSAREDDDSGSSDVQTHTFSIVMLVKTLGSLLGAPLMAVLWVRGIGLGGVALGMPFFISAALYAVAILLFSQIKVD